MRTNSVNFWEGGALKQRRRCRRRRAVRQLQNWGFRTLPAARSPSRSTPWS